MTPTTIPEFVKAIRTKHELSQRDLALKLELSKSVISDVESGKFKRPIEFLKRLNKLLTKQEQQVMVLLLAQTLIDEFNE